MMKHQMHHRAFVLVGALLLALSIAGSVSSQTVLHPIATLPINVSSTSQITGILPVSRGGWGVVAPAPSTSGHVLTSTGTAWISAAAPPAVPTRTAILTNAPGDAGAYPCSSHTHNAPTAWSGSYTAGGNPTRVEIWGSAYCVGGGGVVTLNLKDGGSVVATSVRYGVTGTHFTFPGLVYDTALSAGAHTLSVTVSDGTGTATNCTTPCADDGDRLTMIVSEW